MVDLILKKRRAQALSAAETEWWVNAFVRGEVPDYQASAMLMAICFSGMSSEETVALTLAMAHSGACIDLAEVGVAVDKHSTGGVGDSTTLVCAPLAAACGARVAKISGRGLGHTGGTVDKLESIPGFNAALSPDEFVKAIKRAGLAITGPSAELVPADKMLYALRDVTATVDCIPLIASSIMSKKIAAGAGAIVLDVKVGNGAIMPDIDRAILLAEQMVAIGQGAGRETVALLSDMDQPLGLSVGNSLDIAEAIRILRGEESGPLLELSLLLAAEMLAVTGIAHTQREGLSRVKDAVANGTALAAFRAMVEAQGGDPQVVENPSLLPAAPRRETVCALEAGWLLRCDTVAIGQAAVLLGAGRTRKEDPIDPSAGIVLLRRPGDRVEAGEPLAVLHAGEETNMQEAAALLLRSLHFGPAPPVARPLVQGRVTASATERFVE
ncbi:MAG: thymidine phosphorylase [Bryobacterales bacterium]|nr:thymidine phosphorylase [Bryobacterales bacterium]